MIDIRDERVVVLHISTYRIVQEGCDDIWGGTLALGGESIPRVVVPEYYEKQTRTEALEYLFRNIVALLSQKEGE